MGGRLPPPGHWCHWCREVAVQAAPEEHSRNSTSKGSVLVATSLTMGSNREPSLEARPWPRHLAGPRSPVLGRKSIVVFVACISRAAVDPGGSHGDPRGRKEADVKAVSVDEIGAPRHWVVTGLSPRGARPAQLAPNPGRKGVWCGASRLCPRPGHCPPHSPRHFLPRRALATTPRWVIRVTLLQNTGLMSFGGNE